MTNDEIMARALCAAFGLNPNHLREDGMREWEFAEEAYVPRMQKVLRDHHVVMIKEAPPPHVCHVSLPQVHFK